MKALNPDFKKLILVCTRLRENMACCAARGSESLFDDLKLAMAAKDPSVRVVKTQCLGKCVDGMTIVIQPDNKWFGHVTHNDIEEIVDMAGNGGGIDLELF